MTARSAWFALVMSTGNGWALTVRRHVDLRRTASAMCRG